MGLALGAGAVLGPLAGRARAAREWPVPVELVSAAVPWPRGIVWLDGSLIVLARGRHRSSGGTDPSYDDKAGYLFQVDPRIHAPASDAYAPPKEVQENAQVYVRPTDPPFNLYSRVAPATEDRRTDRPYCTLRRDPVSGNFIICGYSGVDVDAGFRKNATDSVLRYDPRRSRWFVIDQHDPSVVPDAELGKWVDNKYYPHKTGGPPPHGLINGPDNAAVVGRYLYVVAKDNSVLVQYDLTEIRRNPDAPPPPGRVVLGNAVNVRDGGKVRYEYAEGHSALARYGDWLYIGFRTTSQILRVPIDGDGNLVQPIVGEIVARFDPWDPEKKKSADLQDIAFNSRGQLFVSTSQQGRVWRINSPSPAAIFDGTSSTTNKPYVDLRTALKADAKARLPCGNIAFDPQDNLYLCAEGYGGKTIGSIYRIPEVG